MIYIRFIFLTRLEDNKGQRSRMSLIVCVKVKRYQKLQKEEGK